MEDFRVTGVTSRRDTHGVPVQSQSVLEEAIQAQDEGSVPDEQF